MSNATDLSRAHEDASRPATLTGLTRRSVAKGAAWSVPVIATAVAAPAYAASPPPCVQGDATLTNPGSTAVITTLTFGSSGVVADITYTAQGWSDQTPGETGQVRRVEYTPAWNYIKLHHPAGMDRNDTIVMTITFRQVVSNVSLTITDIDKTIGEWIDEVSIEPVSFAITSRGANVTGAGTASSPFTTSVNSGITSAAGDVKLNWPGEVQQITIRYRAADATNSSDVGQHIGIGLIAFDTC